jgi:acyl carrier protein
MSSLAEKINAILADEFEIKAEDLTPDASIQDTLQLDSLDAVDLTVLLEEQTGAKVDPKSFVGLKTLGDIHEMVERVVSRKVG